MTKKDTIFALSSGQGKAGVAVIRVSGIGPEFLPKRVDPRIATLMNFYDIDQVIAIYFKAPNSFNGEDMVEIHCHGGRAIVAAIFEKLKSFGFRMAEPGEFLRRAFDNGKFDLVEVDGIRAMIDAKTERQRAAAMKSMTGQDSKVLENWRSRMIELSAFSSARMDYDETELPGDIDTRILDGATKLASEIKSALASRTHIIEDGFNIVLTGETNVGKSSLFNRILGQERAIVSDIHGTTRDVITAELDIDGFLVRLSDTAGLRDAADEIEKIGIEKSHAETARADLILHVFDRPTDYTPADNEVVVINKSDIPSSIILCHPGNDRAGASSIQVSAKTGEGISQLMNIIRARLAEIADTSDSSLIVTERMRGHLKRAAAELQMAAVAAGELQSEHIMRAADEVGMILGIIGANEIYDTVFGQLCLGK